MNKIFNFGYTKVTSKEKTELVTKILNVRNKQGKELIKYIIQESIPK